MGQLRDVINTSRYKTSNMNEYWGKRKEEISLDQNSLINGNVNDDDDDDDGDDIDDDDEEDWLHQDWQRIHYIFSEFITKMSIKIHFLNGIIVGNKRGQNFSVTKERTITKRGVNYKNSQDSGFSISGLGWRENVLS